MADKKGGAYGGKSGGGDTDFRKTYDRDEYARRAKERETKEREEGKARYEAKLQGKTYHAPASDKAELGQVEARTHRIDVASRIGRTELVSGNAGGGKRGKTGGFYCEICDITLKNSIELAEHYNHPGHLRRAGLELSVKRATLEDVRERLRYLSRKRKEESRVEVLDLDTRLDERRAQEEKEREEKRRKRNEKRRAKKEPEW